MVTLVVDCDGLPDPENGNVAVSGISLDSTAVYTCNEGHSLSTGNQSFTRICGEDSKWNPDLQPTCNRK